MPGNIDTAGQEPLAARRGARRAHARQGDGGRRAGSHRGRTRSSATGASACAAGLAARGVGEGTNVSWILPSRIEAFVLIGALARLGAVQNPILPIYRHREVGFITRQTGCRLLVVPGTFRNVDYEKMAREATEDLDVEVLVADPDLPEGDPSTLGPPASGDGNPMRWLFYTSGTVADPKGARHTRREHRRRQPRDAVVVALRPHRPGRGGVPDHPRRRGRVDVQHDGDRRRAAARRGLQPRRLAGVPRTRSASRSPPRAPCSGRRTSPRSASSPTVPLFPEVRVFAGGGAPKPPHIHYELMAEMGAPAIAGWGLTESPINTMMELDSPRRQEGHHRGQGVPRASSCASSRSTARWPARAKRVSSRCAARRCCLGLSRREPRRRRVQRRSGRR